MLAALKFFGWALLRITAFSFVFGGLAVECDAQDGDNYRFVANTPISVVILNCGDGLCTRESTILENIDFRALSVSASGDKLAGVWFQENMDMVVKLVQLDGTPVAEHLLVDFPGWPLHSTWSPNECWLVLAALPMTGGDCFVNLDELSNGDKTTCTYSALLGNEQRQFVRDPRWSPDGTYLVSSDVSEYYAHFDTYGREDIFVMSMEYMQEYGYPASLSITPGVLSDCGTFDWLSNNEVLYRCYAYTEPLRYHPEHGVPTWYITNVETGEIRRADVPAALIESECMSAFPGTSKVAFNDGESTLSVWDMASGNVEQFTIPAELKDMHCRVEWIPE